MLGRRDFYPAAAAALMVAVVWIAWGGEVYAGRPMDWSASPFNEGPWGTSVFADLLEDAGYRVYFGGPETAEGLARAGAKPLYVAVGPDSYIPEGRAAEIARLVEQGLVAGLLLADETGDSAPLLRELGAPELGEIIEDPPLLRAVCEGGLEAVFSKPAYFPEPGGWEPFCVLEDGRVVAVARSTGGVKILIIGDSSVFTNFMVNALPPLESTRGFVLALVEWASNGSDTVVIDTGIHSLVELPGASVLVSSPVTAASIVFAALARPAVTAAAALAAFLAVAALAVRGGED